MKTIPLAEQLATSLARCEAEGRIDEAWNLITDTTILVPIIPNLDKRMLAAVEEGTLSMTLWHCGSTHCRAGWALIFAQWRGKQLETYFGTETAARLIYEASTGRIAPNFYATQEDAVADIRRCAAL